MSDRKMVWTSGMKCESMNLVAISLQKDLNVSKREIASLPIPPPLFVAVVVVVVVAVVVSVATSSPPKDWIMSIIC